MLKNNNSSNKLNKKRPLERFLKYLFIMKLQTIFAKAVKEEITQINLKNNS